MPTSSAVNHVNVQFKGCRKTFHL